VYFAAAGGFAQAEIYNRYLLQPGSVVDGPAVIEERDSTTLVPPGSTATVDRFRNLILRSRCASDR
jgi:N-methylhydantoinase A/oxoprolinase/acetone carboxylase beta subunit